MRAGQVCWQFGRSGPPPSLSSAVMLSETIATVAPNMPPDIRRWFLEREYAKPSAQDQDWDLILAEWEYVPLLIEYTEDPANLLDKRFESFSALMVLQGYEKKDSDTERKKDLNQEIRRLIDENREFARDVSQGRLGLVEALTVRKMLGEEIPGDVPQWIREEVEHRA